ncbi:hypothetical protein GGQ60_000625 [Pedobacter zeae]|uniref:Uncharacterized protein n=1 Tax=Pedobacter zeae TaxID=1737356 RepID=A0A7W6K7J5_9SPHI|nr:hypothetical protein [Pedobacter zeae]
MENLRKGLSDMLSLIVPKENGKYYTWGEIAIGGIMLSFLVFTISLLPR